VNRFLRLGNFVIKTVVRMIATLLTHLKGFKIVRTLPVVNGFDEEKIIKLAEGIIKYKLSSSVVLNFISRITGEVIENAFKTTSA
jgi:hypothetical protein